MPCTGALRRVSRGSLADQCEAVEAKSVTLAAVDPPAELFSGPEEGDDLARDIDGVAGALVARDARMALPDRKCAKAAQLRPVAASVTCSVRRHFSDYPAPKSLMDEFRKEFGEWHDVLPDARLFQRIHVCVSPFQRHHRPGIAPCR